MMIMTMKTTRTTQSTLTAPTKRDGFCLLWCCCDSGCHHHRRRHRPARRRISDRRLHCCYYCCCVDCHRFCAAAAAAEVAVQATDGLLEKIKIKMKMTEEKEGLDGVSTANDTEHAAAAAVVDCCCCCYLPRSVGGRCPCLGKSQGARPVLQTAHPSQQQFLSWLLLLLLSSSSFLAFARALALLLPHGASSPAPAAFAP